MNSKQRRRRHTRGAVLVEVAVVVPAFIILFGGMLFLHHVVREQQRVGAQAKYEAWTYAMASCAGDGDGVPPPQYTSTMPGAPGSDISLKDSLGRASASSSSTVNVSEVGGASRGNGLFSFSQSVHAHAIVFCNNQTESGTIGGVAKWLIDNIKGLL